MYANLSRSTLRNAKKLIALYRQGKIGTNTLSSWRHGYCSLPTKILGQVHGYSVGEKADPARAEALLSLAERLAKTQIYDGDDQSAQRCIFGFELLTRFHKFWIRPAHEFPLKGGTVDDLFRAFYDHLFVIYPVPKFFHNALSCWQNPDRIISQIEIGQGKSVRASYVRTKFSLSAKGCHWFLHAPNSYRYDEAVKWAFYKSFGGDDATAAALSAVPPEETPFWHSVYTFLAQNNLSDPVQVKMIVNYIWATKFRGYRLPNGLRLPPPQPDFQMKGRSLTSLLRVAQKWRIEGVLGQKWKPCSLLPYFTEDDTFDYGVVELLNSNELGVEGRRMQHCVGTYVEACASRTSAIFSCQSWRKGTRAVVERLLTIEVLLPKKRIIQARGRFNVAPRDFGKQLLLNFAKLNGLETSE